VRRMKYAIVIEKVPNSNYKFEENCTQRSVGQFFLTQFAEPDLALDLNRLN
jgi:hypothetical protein